MGKSSKETLESEAKRRECTFSPMVTFGTRTPPLDCAAASKNECDCALNFAWGKPLNSQGSQSLFWPYLGLPRKEPTGVVYQELQLIVSNRD